MHDLTVARIWGFIAELATCGLVVLGDKGYLGEEDIRTLYRGGTSPPPRRMPTAPMLGSAPLASVPMPAQVPLKSWRILRKLRCCLWRAGQLAEAVHVLHMREIAG